MEQLPVVQRLLHPQERGKSKKNPALLPTRKAILNLSLAGLWVRRVKGEQSNGEQLDDTRLVIYEEVKLDLDDEELITTDLEGNQVTEA